MLRAWDKLFVAPPHEAQNGRWHVIWNSQTLLESFQNSKAMRIDEQPLDLRIRNHQKCYATIRASQYFESIFKAIRIMDQMAYRNWRKCMPPAIASINPATIPDIPGIITRKACHRRLYLNDTKWQEFASAGNRLPALHNSVCTKWPNPFFFERQCEN